MKSNNVDVSKTYNKYTDSSSEESIFHIAHSSKIPAVHAVWKENTILS